MACASPPALPASFSLESLSCAYAHEKLTSEKCAAGTACSPGIPGWLLVDQVEEQRLHRPQRRELPALLHQERPRQRHLPGGTIQPYFASPISARTRTR